MTRNLLIGGIAALIPVIGLKAQEPPAPAAGTDSRKTSIANLETHITQREQRLAERGSDIVGLDTRIEQRAEELVRMLASLPDSGEAADGVTQLKKEVVQGLMRAMDAYSSKRAEVAELARAGDSAAEKDLGKFDERITKRVGQIADLTKSLPAHDTVENQELEGASFWNGYYYERDRLSGESGLKKSDAKAADKQAGDTVESLHQALERLDQRRRSLLALLVKPKVTDAAKQLYTRELGRLAANKDHLQTRLRDITVAALAAGKPAGVDKAHEITELIEDSRRDLREDVARLFLCYDQFVKERRYVEYLKASLAAGKDALDRNSPKQ